MAKAYDSISIEGLRRALIRIDVPNSIVNFLIALFRNREIKVITYWGTTEPFIAGDGIDQGDTISPLLWKIFYNPLLSRIQGDESIGYTMSTKYTKIPQFKSSTKTLKVRVASLVYMDDTVWIHNSKEGLQKIINKSEEFFKLNDI